MSHLNVRVFLTEINFTSVRFNDYQPVIGYIGRMGESLGQPITAEIYLSLVHTKCNAALVGGLAGHTMTMQEWSYGGGYVMKVRMREPRSARVRSDE
jgi:hypothetical protein